MIQLVLLTVFRERWFDVQVRTRVSFRRAEVLSVKLKSAALTTRPPSQL